MSTYLLLKRFAATEKTGWKRARFYLRVWKRNRLHREWFSALDTRCMREIVAADPAVIQRIQRTYISTQLTPEQRLRVLRTHFLQLARLPDALRSEIYSPQGLRICLFEDAGLHHELRLQHLNGNGREGELSLVWDCGQERIAIVTFCLSIGTRGDRVMVVGGMQGPRSEQGAQLFRDLTKRMHGLRPLPAAVHMLRTLAAAFGVERIVAVSDAAHAVYHPRARCSHKKTLAYDDLWQEQGGQPSVSGFYTLPLSLPRKPLEDVQSHKRAMYRRRYQMLDALDAAMLDSLAWAAAISSPPEFAVDADEIKVEGQLMPVRAVSFA